MQLPNLLASKWGRLIAFFCLYVTEGIPLGFTATAIATQLRRSGVGPKEISFFIGWLYFPWAWKWVMGPVVELFYSNKLGARRGWIIGTQIMMVCTLMFCVPLELTGDNLTLLTSIILVHNFFCATQDVAIDSLACNTLQPEERGLANGLMFAGQTLGIPLGGACVLYLVDGLNVEWLPMLQTGIPFEQSYFFVAGCILLVTVLVALPMREETLERPKLEDGRRSEIEKQLARPNLGNNPIIVTTNYASGFVCGFVASQLLKGGLGFFPEVKSLVYFVVPELSAALVLIFGLSFRLFGTSLFLAKRLLPNKVDGRVDVLRVELVDYMLTAVRSFFGSRVAFAALIFAVIPGGAAALNLALQKTLAVELGMSDSEIADLEVVSSVVWAVCCVTGGLISDRIGHLKSLAVFLVLMSIPTLWLGFEMDRQGFVMPREIVQADKPLQAESLSGSEPSSADGDIEQDHTGKKASEEDTLRAGNASSSEGESPATDQSVAEPEEEASVVPPGLVNSFWWAVMFYMATQGLMYGTRTAVFMQISNPAVAATQFTAYMAMQNLVTSYTAWWQGVVIESHGYPITLFIDASTGLICLAVLPFLFQKAVAEPAASIPAPCD